LTEPDIARSTRSAALVLILFIISLAVFVWLAARADALGSPPTDEELTARFLSHEADFTALVKMIDSDRRVLPLGTEPFDLADIVAAGAGTARIRIDNYKILLAKIDARNFRYCPRHGNVVVPVSESRENSDKSTKSYLYLSRDEPPPLAFHQRSGGRGSGIYSATVDERIKGRWFIRHDRTVAVAIAPY
jgi:hypothetical protein